MIDAGGAVERAVADRVVDDRLGLLRAIAEYAQGFRHRLVDDLEVAAASKFLELDQGKVGLDAGGIAIHQEADSAGGGQHGGLRIAEAKALAFVEHLVPEIAASILQDFTGSPSTATTHVPQLLVSHPQ